MENRTAIWAAASVVAILMLCVTVLAAMGKDTTPILTVVAVVVVPVLGGLGYSKINGLERTTEAVRQQTNGNQTQQMDLIREMVRQVMAQQGKPATENDPVQPPPAP